MQIPPCLRGRAHAVCPGQRTQPRAGRTSSLTSRVRSTSSARGADLRAVGSAASTALRTSCAAIKRGLGIREALVPNH